MKIKKFFRVFLYVALLMGVVANTAVVNAADKVKVEFWTMSLKPKFTPYFETLVKNYEAQNPNVQVEWNDVPWDVLQAKLTASIAAGTPPALVQLNVPWAYEYAQQGELQPVDTLYGQEKICIPVGP